MSERIDWTTTEGCPRCDVWSDDLHCAWHPLVAALLSALRIPKIVDRLARLMTRV